MNKFNNDEIYINCELQDTIIEARGHFLKTKPSLLFWEIIHMCSVDLRSRWRGGVVREYIFEATICGTLLGAPGAARSQPQGVKYSNAVL